MKFIVTESGNIYNIHNCTHIFKRGWLSEPPSTSKGWITIGLGEGEYSYLTGEITEEAADRILGMIVRWIESDERIFDLRTRVDHLKEQK